MAVVWPEAREYVIYIASPTEAGDWEQLIEGVGTAVVWAAADSTFAVLASPQAAVPEFQALSKRKGKAREEEAERHATVVAALANANRSVTIQVRHMSSTTRLHHSKAGGMILWHLQRP